MIHQTETTVADVLTEALAAIRQDGWHPTGWSIIPPWCIKAAINSVVAQRYFNHDGERRNQLNKAVRDAIKAALGYPDGGITHWELAAERSQADVERVLEHAIKEAQA